MKHLLSKETVKEARFYKKLRADKVECSLCERRCVLSPGETGYCKTRVNIDGKLYTLVYGDLSAIESRPIEIKPFYHYWPGSTATTISTWSCNFSCLWCQNYSLSRTEPNPELAIYRPPEDVIRYARYWNDEGLCISFQEPTLLTEYALDLFKLGVKIGLYCCYVSNGYMTLEALRELIKSGLTGLKIDIKGDKNTYLKYCGGVDVNVPWRNARFAKEQGIHTEIVCLIVTGVNDDETIITEIVNRHLKELGPNVPIHFTRYYPAYKWHEPPTSIKLLEQACEIARKSGINYVYIGNVPGHKLENTYCPNCGELLIKRYIFDITRINIVNHYECPKCSTKIKIIGEIV